MKCFKLSFGAIVASALCLLSQPAYSDLSQSEEEDLKYAQEEVQAIVPTDLVAKSYNKNRDKPKFVNSWKPYLAPRTFKQPCYPFLMTSVGFGLLRFSCVSGSLASNQPVGNFSKKFVGRLAYSRTPLVEIVSGYQVSNWFQVAFSYQHQGDIDVQTKVQSFALNAGNQTAIGAGNTLSNAQFSSSLRLDSFALKFYLDCPVAVVWKTMAYSGYLAVAGGPAWQSWTNMKLNFQSSQLGAGSGVVYFAGSTGFKNKYCGNFLLMLDPGIRVRSVVPQRNLTVLFGCKFNLWGQARNLGSIEQNRDYNHVGLVQPIAIKTVYQFSPYVGFQMDF